MIRRRKRIVFDNERVLKSSFTTRKDGKHTSYATKNLKLFNDNADNEENNAVDGDVLDDHDDVPMLAVAAADPPRLSRRGKSGRSRKSRRSKRTEFDEPPASHDSGALTLPPPPRPSGLSSRRSSRSRRRLPPPATFTPQQFASQTFSSPLPPPPVGQSQSTSSLGSPPMAPPPSD